MATNRTMLMAMGKLGKKPADEYDDEAPESESGDDDEAAEEKEEPDDKKQAFVDMCRAIRAGKDDKAYELYQDICEGM
jgi:hypothetical protein